MSSDPSFHDFVTQRQITEMVMGRVAEHVYDRAIINNVERADYVECLVELIMQSADPRWRLTETWDAWDVEHTGTGARLEIKQSSFLQSWSGPSSATTEANPRFDISSREWDWSRCAHGEYHNSPSEGGRSADVYVFAWHGEPDEAFADQRAASQWEFLVVPESELPAQKSIGLNPLRQLARRCTYRSLASEVLEAIPDRSLLKAERYALREPCRYCRPGGS